MTTTNQTISMKRAFLYTLIGSVCCSALLGIGAVVVGDFGDFEIRILLTTLSIAAASVCGLSCGAVLETGRAKTLPYAGIGLSLLGALLIIVGLWGKLSETNYWKVSATVSILGVACSHVSLLLLAHLSPRFHWAHWAAHAAIFFVAAVIVFMLWGEFDEESAFRVLGVASILATAITILVPVFHRLSRGDFDSASEASVADLDRQIRLLEHQLTELRRQRDRLDPPDSNMATAK